MVLEQFQQRLLLTTNKLISLYEIPFRFRLIIAERQSNEKLHRKSMTVGCERWLRNDCRRRKFFDETLECHLHIRDFY